jgi:NADH-quinone oxidoreductase subunit C
MTNTNTSEMIKSKFDGIISSWNEKNAKRIYFDLPSGKIRDLVNYLFNDVNLRFIIASGIDVRKSIDILYHFADDSTGIIYTAKVTLSDKKNLKIDSISDLFIGSAWIEREIHELLGVDFTGNDNLKHLLLHDDWPKGSYPLRNDNE